jgi:hypothetical protein
MLARNVLHLQNYGSHNTSRQVKKLARREVVRGTNPVFMIWPDGRNPAGHGIQMVTEFRGESTMRVNLYSEEVTDEVERRTKIADGVTFTGVEFLVGKRVEQTPGDDVSSAVTFWFNDDGVSRGHLRTAFTKALAILDGPTMPKEAGKSDDEIRAELEVLRQETHRSWANLRRELEDGPHGTPQVDASVKTFANKARERTGLTSAELLEWLKKMRLGFE